jgi:hypothetical protein
MWVLDGDGIGGFGMCGGVERKEMGFLVVEREGEGAWSWEEGMELVGVGSYFVKLQVLGVGEGDYFATTTEPVFSFKSCCELSLVC